MSLESLAWLAGLGFLSVDSWVWTPRSGILGSGFVGLHSRVSTSGLALLVLDICASMPRFGFLGLASWFGIPPPDFGCLGLDS